MATRPHRPDALSSSRGILPALLILCLCSTQCSHQSLTGEKPEVLPRAAEITLDVTPMTEPLSAFVQVGQDGQARAAHYSRSQLRVAAVYQGKLSASHVSQLFARTNAPAFAEALRRGNFGGTGLTRGDQFHLSIKSREGGGECFGFVEDAPAVVRDFIRDLLALKAQLKEAALSDAYVRSEPIAAERFAALRQRGQVRFAAVRDFPPDIQPILTGAVSRPRDFLPISRTQYEQLLPQASHGPELFLAAEGSGYQLTLFKARDTTAPPTKGDQ